MEKGKTEDKGNIPTGLIEVNMDTFGEALSYLFTYQLDCPYFYSNIEYIYENGQEKETRHMALVAPKQYATYQQRNFREMPIEEREGQTLFQRKPLHLIDEAYLLGFTKQPQEKISIGHQSNRAVYSLGLRPELDTVGEIQYENVQHGFVDDFIYELLKHKQEKGIDEITDEDIYEVLQKYGIYKREFLVHLSNMLQDQKDQAQQTTQKVVVITKKSE